MHGLLIGELALLLALSNGVPIMATRLLGTRLSHPIDGGGLWRDGKPLFGASKTFRGILLSVAVTSAGSALLGFPWSLGAVVAGLSMAGDLVSSFTKRRLGLPAGSRATGLDQIPESLFPLLAVARALPLNAGDVAATLVIFFAGEILLSRVLYRLHIRDRPY